MIRITPQTLIYVLLTAVFILLMLHLGSYYYVIISGLDASNIYFEKLNFGKEKNLPAIFSACLLFTASILLAVTGTSKLMIKSGKMFWYLLSFIFLFLGFDELLRIHEKIDFDISTQGSAEGIFHYSWVIPYGIALVVIASIIIKPLFTLPKPTLYGFILAGTIFVSGALGIEMLTGWYLVNQGLEKEIHIELIPEIFTLNTIEELLEMTGSGIFIYFILDFLHKFGYKKDQQDILDLDPNPATQKIRHRFFG